jgi:hypothetical protein
MKFRINFILSMLFLLALLSACKQDIAMETTVYPDGSLDRTIQTAHSDEHQEIQTIDARPNNTVEITRAAAIENMFGLRVEDGWALATRMIPADVDSTTIYTFRRHFSSVDEANATLATPADTLFRVTSTFEKKFRWFYTYLYYADTYHAINRMDYPVENYVTPEDYTFIDRLPAEGKKITPADSIYFAHLHDKLVGDYGLRALYECYYDLTVKLMQETHVENKWFDTLRAHKESMLRDVVARHDINDDYILHTIDSIGIPLSSAQTSTLYSALLKSLDKKLGFMSVASDATYRHRINMPWDVVRTNADSISGNQLFWNPPAIKFLIKDYTFYAESRQLNYWAVAISGIVIALTVFLFVRRRV